MKFYNSGSREPQSYTAKATKKVTQIPNKKKKHTHKSQKKTQKKRGRQTKVVTASENSKKKIKKETSGREK